MSPPITITTGGSGHGPVGPSGNSGGVHNPGGNGATGRRTDTGPSEIDIEWAERRAVQRMEREATHRGTLQALARPLGGAQPSSVSRSILTDLASQMEALQLQRPFEPGEIDSLRSACSAASFTMPKGAEAQVAAEFAGLLADAANDFDVAGDLPAAHSAVDNARLFLDLALDFVPGVSALKDTVSVLRGANSVTGEALNEVERGLLLAGFFVPGALKGTVRAASAAAKALAALVKRGSKSAALAKQLAPSVQAAARVATQYGSHVEKAFISKEVQDVAKTWGTSSSGFNQLLTHTLGKAAEPARLKSIEKHAGAAEGTLTAFLRESTPEAAKQSMMTADAIANGVLASGEKVIVESVAAKNIYWAGSKVDAKQGLAVVDYEGRKQSLMIMSLKDWLKRKARGQ